MKRIISVIFVLCLTFSAKAQLTNWEFGLVGGISNYVGDINSMFNDGVDDSKEWNQFESSFNMYNIHFVGGLMARYNFNPRWALRGEILFTKLSGDDSHFDNIRNLSFHSSLQELSGIVEFNFMDYRIGSRKHRFTPYIFAGLGLFHFNPKTEIIDPIEQEQVTVSLHDLNTEGQGLRDGKDQYSLWQVAVPFGLGVKFSICDYVAIGAEWGFRKTFTDYIDDISTTYVNNNDLRLYAGDQAATAADRTNELDGQRGVYHAEGEFRGNKSTKDWYNFAAITLTFRLSNGSSRCSKTHF